jgi:hypothetical protein
LGRNLVGKVLTIGFGIDYLDIAAKVQATKAQINRYCYIKL